MMSKLFAPFCCVLAGLGLPLGGQAQSLEMAAGHRYVFADVQWLAPFDARYRYSLFSRTRVTVDYDNRANLFSGAYLNHTTRWGIGPSLVAKVGQANGAGADAGLHIFVNKPWWTFFGLASAGLTAGPEYSWFSILRLRPRLGQGPWRLFMGIELFHLFRDGGHAYSVERLRLGLERAGWQWGFAGDFEQRGPEWMPSENLGLFLRKAF